jgi:transcription antitermination factor NusG
MNMTDAGKIAWYALVVKARYEKVVSQHLSAQDYEVFLPLVKTRRRWSDRIKELEVPLFPGYVLSRFDPADRLRALMIPGVSHVVSFDRRPTPIPDCEVESVRTVLDSDLKFEPWPFLGVGQRVRVEHGSLYGLEGLIVDIRKSKKLVVSLNLLQRSVAVEIDHDWVVPVSSSPRRLEHLPVA